MIYDRRTSGRALSPQSVVVHSIAKEPSALLGFGLVSDSDWHVGITGF